MITNDFLQIFLYGPVDELRCEQRYCAGGQSVGSDLGYQDTDLQGESLEPHLECPIFRTLWVQAKGASQYELAPHLRTWQVKCCLED